MKKHLPTLTILALFAALVCASGSAAEGARRGLAVCARSLVPSLLPFFVLSGLLSAMGLPDLLGGLFGGAMERLFAVSPAGAQAFFLGVTGGYPLGAAAVADLRRGGRVSRAEAERLLAFCNDSGPAFILGAVGGIFHSPRAGALLYVTHVLGAMAVGLLFRRRDSAPPPAAPAERTPPVSFAQALPAAMSKAVAGVMSVCGYVVMFSALLGMAEPWLRLPPLGKALLTGFFELGSGAAAMAGLAPTPVTLAACALMLGWGGLSVHCQTLGVLAGTDISCARHLAGRALCGAISAVFTYAAALALFQ